MNSSSLRSTCTALLISFLVVAGIFFMLGGFYGQLLLPLFRWELATFFPDYQIMYLGIARQGTELFFTVQSVLPVPCLIGTTILPAGTALTGSTLLANSLQHPVILLSMTVAAWFIREENGGRLLVFSFILLLVIEFVDVPLVLIGSMEDLLFEQFAPNMVSHSFVIYWMNFLNEGGRLALSITGGILAIMLGLKRNVIIEQPAGNRREETLQYATANPDFLQRGQGEQ